LLRPRQDRARARRSTTKGDEGRRAEHGPSRRRREAAGRAALAGYKIPRAFEFWPEIPRSPVGKVLKRAIRERFWQGRARAV
jgi:acyl-CoA synthetase (AMP-forming)/AMP-acid ligase II